MCQFASVTVFVVFLIINADITVKSMNTKELNDRIFSVIDELFISLKINTKMINPNNLEDYTALHSFIQDELYKKEERYEEISNNIETAINNKTADHISAVNEVIDEMIRERAVVNISSILRNETELFNVNATLKGYVDLLRLVKTKEPIDFSAWSPNASEEVQGRRIFGGRSTGITRYPFMASVHIAGRFVCAGSLLHESLAISAASCLMRIREEPDLPIQLRLGSDYVTKKGYLVNIDRVIFHPDFDRSTLANNLVLLKTKKSIRFIRKKVVAISYDKLDFQLKDAKNIMILGWGKRGPADKSNDDQPLSRARLNLYDLEECKYIYNKDYVTDKTFCAGFVDRGDGACNHDGGGPALVGSLLTGVISFGSPHCGRVDAPTVFTRLGRYADWIDSALDSAPIAKGKLANTLQNYGILGSAEDAMGSEEIAAENPREVLLREFGIKKIQDGPIDPSKDGKTDIKKPKPANLRDTVEQDYDATDILNGPIDLKASLNTVQNTTSTPVAVDLTNTYEPDNKDTDELQSNTVQIILSDDSEERTTLKPAENSPQSLENEKEEKEQSSAFGDIMKQLFENTFLKDNVTKTRQNSEETADVDSQNEPSTTKDVETTTELEALDVGNQVANEDGEVNLRLNIDNKNTKSNEKMTWRETPQFNIQYQVEIKPIIVPISEEEKNNSLIILSESGTTHRTKVYNAELLTNKLKKGMKALVKHMNLISVKELSDNS